MGSEMDTFAARLASFDVVLKPEKRRSSGVKGPRFIAWPHSKPSPAELAQAGFFYKPYESNPDNTTCFECGRALDGWEEEDNPITEHLKHSPDCGWAITMDIQQNSSNPSAIEDPTSERITQARLATFGSAWPHDEKRGWICQSEKMVEGGWYFCPTEESNDLASCAYCKLSLDGWEPKDDPLMLLLRICATPRKKGKGSKSRKPRVSKASSRLSTQSVGTTTSEAPEDLDDSMDQSIMSQASVKPKATKKGAKGKGKSTKTKKEEVEAESQMELDSIEQVQPEPEAPKTKRAGRGKKRDSQEMVRDQSESLAEAGQSSIEPPSKRRNTRTRSSSSVSQTFNHEHDYEMPDAAPADEVPEEEHKKGRKGSKKGTSKSRKASDASAASKSTSKSRLPRDSELDAAIEAGLEADAPEQVESESPVEPEAEPEPEVQPAPRASKKVKTSKKTKAAKAAEQQAQELEDPMNYEEQPETEPKAIAKPDVDAMEVTEEQAESAPKAKAAKGTKKKGTKKSKKEDSKSKASASRESSQNKSITDDQPANEHHESFVSVEIVNQEREPEPEYQTEPQAEPEEPQPEPEVKTPEKPVTKKSSKKDDKAKKSKKTKKKEPSPSPEPVMEETVEEHTTEPEPVSPSADEEWGTPDDLPDQVEMVAPAEPSLEPSPEPQIKQRTPVPPKTVKRFSDIPQEEHLTESITKPQVSRGSMQRASRGSKRSVSPLPPAHQHTPSMSPQSSDAENRPPSSRPSASRPAVPTAEPQERTPRAATTPSPSKRNFNGGFAASNHPWTPVDIDEALFGEASDKENADLSGLFNGMKRGLTSPEKKMTVEEWIMWNAKNGEERLKRECERLVGQFEKEGSRGMQRLEAIECID
ncbi:hypothetical protein N7451_011902 [Penicillium sp. IBT 35674x]|nr:hypothetical protein N7451_011902 [Penicillium sp. IBT 35674x]